VNRLKATQNVLKLEAAAAQLKERAKAIRLELDADARRELEEQGSAPTWRLADLGTWSLPVSKEAAVITDRAALTEWVKERWPDEIDETIKPAFEAAMRSWLDPVGEVVIFRHTGEVVPGLGVRPGGVPQSLRFKANGDALAVADQHADELVAQVTAGLGIGAGDD
jgi:hypothetical protein